MNKTDLITRQSALDAVTMEGCGVCAEAINDIPAATGWIPITEQLPEVDEDGYSDNILISFANFSLPCIGEYRVDNNGDGAFYEGDKDDKPLIAFGLVVNAWMPLPEPYREGEE